MRYWAVVAVALAVCSPTVSLGQDTKPDSASREDPKPEVIGLWIMTEDSARRACSGPWRGDQGITFQVQRAIEMRADSMFLTRCRSWRTGSTSGPSGWRTQTVVPWRVVADTIIIGRPDGKIHKLYYLLQDKQIRILRPMGQRWNTGPVLFGLYERVDSLP